MFDEVNLIFEIHIHKLHTISLPKIAHCGGLGKCAVVRCTNNGNDFLYLSKGDNLGMKCDQAIFPLVLFIP